MTLAFNLLDHESFADLPARGNPKPARLSDVRPFSPRDQDDGQAVTAIEIYGSMGASAANLVRSHLPSANSLVVFEATARHLSFTKAAAELRVTQAAVSRQIKLLEDYIGVQVFDRVHRGINLTSDGRALYDSVSHYLEDVVKTVVQIKNLCNTTEVHLSASNAVSAHWLILIISRFREAHPKFRVHLVSYDLPAEPGRGSGIDLLFRFGNGKWPGLDATWICDEEIVPVCSPEFLRRHGSVESLDHLSTLPLIESNRDKSLCHLSWAAWLGHFGHRYRDGEENIFSNYAITIEAARASQGIALGWKRCIEGLLKRGDLVQAINVSLPMPGGYYVAAAKSAPLNPAAEALRKWLVTMGSTPSRI